MESLFIGDAVWAVIPECQYWPALVVEAKEEAMAWKKKKSSDDYVFLYFFGLASYGWILKCNVLPYLENKESLGSNSLQYFSGLDKVSGKLFLFACEEMEYYIEKRKVVDSEKDSIEKERLLKELIIDVKFYSRDFDRFRNRPSLLYAISCKKFNRMVIIEKSDDRERLEEPNLTDSIEFKRQKFKEQKLVDDEASTSKNNVIVSEEDTILKDYRDHARKINFADFWKSHISDAFSVGDLVWARMSGYVPWPGQIVEPVVEKLLKKKPKKSGTTYFCICFYGTYSHAWISKLDLIPYNKYKRILALKGIEDLCRKKRSVHSFDLACKQAEEASEELEDIKSGKIDVELEAINNDKRDREKRRYGFEIFNKRNKITSKAYAEILQKIIPAMPSRILEFRELNGFFMEIAHNEYKKRKIEMEKEEIEGINIEVEAIAQNYPQAGKGKNIKSPKESNDTLQEELEYDTNNGYKFRNAKKVYRKKISHPKKTKKVCKFPNIKSLPSFKETLDPEKHPVFKNEYQRLFQFLISEDDLNGRRNTISTDRITQLSSEILGGNFGRQGSENEEEAVEALNEAENDHILNNTIPSGSREPAEDSEDSTDFLGFDDIALQGTYDKEDDGITKCDEPLSCNVDIDEIKNKEEASGWNEHRLPSTTLDTNNGKKHPIKRKGKNVFKKNKKIKHGISSDNSSEATRETIKEHCPFNKEAEENFVNSSDLGNTSSSTHKEESTKDNNGKKTMSPHGKSNTGCSSASSKAIEVELSSTMGEKEDDLIPENLPNSGTESFDSYAYDLDDSSTVDRAHTLNYTNPFGSRKPAEDSEDSTGFLGFDDTSLQRTYDKEDDGITKYDQPLSCSTDIGEIKNKDEATGWNEHRLPSTTLDTNNGKKYPMKRKGKNILKKNKKLKHEIPSDNSSEATRETIKEHHPFNREVDENFVNSLDFGNTSLSTYKEESTQDNKEKKTMSPHEKNNTGCFSGSLKAIEVDMSSTIGEKEDDLIPENLPNSNTESFASCTYDSDDSSTLDPAHSASKTNNMSEDKCHYCFNYITKCNKSCAGMREKLRLDEEKKLEELMRKNNNKCNSCGHATSCKYHIGGHEVLSQSVPDDINSNSIGIPTSIKSIVEMYKCCKRAKINAQRPINSEFRKNVEPKDISYEQKRSSISLQYLLRKQRALPYQ